MKMRLVRILIFVALLAGSGCGSAQKRPQTFGPSVPEPATEKNSHPNEPLGPPLPFGPTAPSSQTAEVFGPTTTKSRPVVLVLGPGFARGFAYAGVIKALNEAHIPIAAIIGTEMGGLIGALYGLSGSANDFEWSLQKFKEKVFLETPLFSSREPLEESDGSKLESALRQTLGQKDLHTARIPVKIIASKSGVILIQEGNAAQAVRAALAVPGFFTAGSWDGQPAYAAAADRPFAISEAKLLGLGPVVVVDVMTAGDAAGQASTEQRRSLLRVIDAVGSAQSEFRDADILIQPDMNGIGYLEYNKRTEAAFRGKTATQSKILDIKKLVGDAETR